MGGRLILCAVIRCDEEGRVEGRLDLGELGFRRNQASAISSVNMFCFPGQEQTFAGADIAFQTRARLIAIYS